MATRQQRLAARRTRGGLRTGIAIVLLAFMLFPVYWMLNISLQPSGGTLPASFFPPRPSMAGCATAIQDQGPNLVTSIGQRSESVVAPGGTPRGVVRWKP